VDLSDLGVVDGHAHPLISECSAVSVDGFLEFFSEGRPGAMAGHLEHTRYFQRTVRALARRLGCDATVPAVLERRRARGAEAAAAMLAECRVDALVVDTGYPPDAMSLGDMRRLLPCAVYEVFRVETCAQGLLARGLPFEDFVAAFDAELRAAAQRSVAFKSIIAYRSGLAIQAWPEDATAAAYRRATERLRAGGSARLIDKPLLDALFERTLEAARETGRPLQIHAGFGDPDIDLLQANPLLLRPLLEDPRWTDVRIILLHMAYPYVREAAFMSAVWPQVWLDLSLALPFLGAGAVGPLTEILALAPASKLMYGSDVRGVPELFALSARWGRDALGEALDWLGRREGFDVDTTRAIARQILSGNADALYRLPGVSPGS
jgi:predicted TIM-barrel fold metal-dependent hydrolase